MQNRHQYVQLLCVLLRGWEYIKVWYIARQVLIELLPRRINRFAVPYLRNITFQTSVNTASVSPKNWPNVQILWIINSYTTLIVCLFSDTCKYCIVSTSSQWREAGGLGPAPTKRRKQMWVAFLWIYYANWPNQVGPQNGTSETAGRPLKAAPANGGGDGDQVLPSSS